MEHYRFTDGDRRFRIGTSVGIVEIDSDWPDSVALLQAADAACLSAKEAGGNNFRLWRARDADIQLQREEIGWAARIAEAIDRDQFCLHIQEIVSVAPSSRRQGEILLRLREADGSLTLPGKFLPAAERFNLIGRIDRWVLIRTIQGLQVDGVLEGIESVSVNLSGRSVADVGFHRFAIDALVGAGAEICKRLIFEITETAAIGHLATAANFIEQLHSIGIRVALDDFGAGTASFGYLRALKVDLLKIDGQFVKNLDGDPLAEVTIRCFVEIAKTLGIEIVAEWVDRPSLVDQLTNMGVDHLQGFHIARPLPIETFLHRRTESVGDRADQ